MAGHIPGALSNTFRDSFATWLGWLLPEDAALLFVLGDESLERVLDECLLVGYERFAGVLAGGMQAWEAAGLPVNRAELADVEGALRRSPGCVSVGRPRTQASSLRGTFRAPCTSRWVISRPGSTGSPGSGRSSPTAGTGSARRPPSRYSSGRDLAPLITSMAAPKPGRRPATHSKEGGRSERKQSTQRGHNRRRHPQSR